MKIGCCVSAKALLQDNETIDASRLADRLAWLARAGVDFLELAAVWLESLDERDFAGFKRALERSRLSAPVCNLFLPGRLRLIGPDRDDASLRGYVTRALDRLERIGARAVVFGSGRARRIPDGYDADKARSELRSFVEWAADEAGDRGIAIVLEPLRREECNALNFVRDGYALVTAVNHPHFWLLADTFHMEELGEPLAVLHEVKAALRHVHTADSGRVPPGAGDYDHGALFQTLKAIGYAGDVSIECNWTRFDEELPDAVTRLRQCLVAGV